MDDHRNGSQDTSRPPAGGRRGGVLSQVRLLSWWLRISPGRRRLLLLAVAIVAVICGSALGQIRLNAWHGDFYDALEQKNIAAFWQQTLVFTAIVSVLLALGVAQTWLHEMLKVGLRERLTRDLLDGWLKPGRLFRLAFAGEIGVNPDQRIQEDTRHLTELSVDLAVGLLQSSLLLLSFVGVLWSLSEQVAFGPESDPYVIPGYMVWCAVGYALVGSSLTWLVGRPLIALNAERYGREAEFRFGLVRVDESAEGIAMYGGEPDERRTLENMFDRVTAILTRLASALAKLTWITAGYGWLAIVAPLIVAAPGYFGGSLSFGGLMMVVNAFYQVQQSLRWFVDNFARIADWRATMIRVESFREALPALDRLGEDAGRITLRENVTGPLTLEGLGIQLPDGRAVLEPDRVELQPGEHVLIVGDAGSGKSTLFRAIAGLWPWGSGVIGLPPRASMMFVPNRPYLPLGTLRAAAAYPAGPDRFSDDSVRTAFERVGLGRLLPDLDRANRWDRDLTLEEQRRLVYARLLLHAPRWVFLDEAIDTLEEEHKRLVLSLFERELAGTTVISVGRSATNGFYQRQLQVRRIADVPGLRLPAPLASHSATA